jgi:hypothetical protein
MKIRKKTTNQMVMFDDKYLHQTYLSGIPPSITMKISPWEGSKLIVKSPGQLLAVIRLQLITPGPAFHKTTTKGLSPSNPSLFRVYNDVQESLGKKFSLSKGQKFLPSIPKISYLQRIALASYFPQARNTGLSS